MTNSISPQTRLELISLAQSIRQSGLQSGARDMLLIGNGLLTLIAAAESEDSLQAINALLLEFTLRQVKREAGLTEAQIIVCEALDQSRLN
jgi:hypothetical protein